jgi:hypothetical protein
VGQNASATATANIITIIVTVVAGNPLLLVNRRLAH